MINKESIVAVILWFGAVIGAGSDGVIEKDVADKPEMAVVAASVAEMATGVFEQNEAIQPTKILLETFTFNERSPRVARLQGHIGVKVDSHYGTATRKAHMTALQEKGLDTSVVPSLPTSGANRYNIPSNPEQRCPEFEPLFAQYGLKPVEVFSYIAYRESRCRPKAVNAKWDSKGNITWTLNKNGTIDRGLLQINSSWKTVTKQVCKTDMEGLFNLDCNLKVAKYLMDNSSDGLGNWRIWKR